jgi:hypothetical protein
MGTLIIPKLNNTPFFNRGNLVYKNSGHTLTQLNGYYMCSQRQKGKSICGNEGNLKVEDFERRFKRYVDKLKIDEETARKLFYEVDRKGVDLREKIEPQETKQNNNMNICIKAIERDIKDKKKIKTGDITSFKESYIRALKINYEKYLLILIMDCLKFLGKPGTKTSDEWFSTFFYKIYLSDTGKILSLKMEGIGDYIIRLIENKIPGYLKTAEVNITERINFPSLDFVKVMDYFRENNYRDTLSFFPFGSEYAEEKQSKQLFEWMKKAEDKEILKTLYFLKDISKSPMALLNLKMYSKNNNEKVASSMEKKKARYGKNIKYTAVGLAE